MKSARTTGPSAARSVTNLTSITEEYELFHYEWPDLPPLTQIKDAVARRRLAKGVSYVLPVDRSANSMQQNYRTDLRVLFKEPYLTEDTTYRDSLVMRNAQKHLQMTSAPGKLRARENLRECALSADCARARLHFQNSAPNFGVTGKFADERLLKRRSNLYQTVKTVLPPEVVKLKHEAESIAKAVGAKPDRNYDEAVGKTQEPQLIKVSNKHKKPSAKKFVAAESYDDLLKMDVLGLMADRLKTPYLTKEKTKNIVGWLNESAKMTELDVFFPVAQ